MNKSRREAAVLNRGPAEAEAAARRVNAEPWQPLSGMVKLRCADCRYWFAASDLRTPRCPDCDLRRQRGIAATHEAGAAA